MPLGHPFKGHQFTKDVILLVVRRYCRLPVSRRNLRDLPAQLGITVHATTVYLWVQKFERAPAAGIAAGAVRNAMSPLVL